MKTEPTSKRIPPYLPFKTFINSLDALSQGVPPKLDRTLWKGQSGFTQGLIMSTYRFFGLVDANDASSKALDVLAHHPDKRPAELKRMLTDQYAFLALEKLDLTKTTMKMLEDAFTGIYPVSGDTKQKAITFFLKAAKFSDLSMSPYLLTQLRNTAKRPTRKPRQRLEEGQSNGTALNAPPTGLGSHSVLLAGGGRLTITISANPFTMPTADRKFFFELVDRLQEYGKQNPEAQAPVPDDDSEGEEE